VTDFFSLVLLLSTSLLLLLFLFAVCLNFVVIRADLCSSENNNIGRTQFSSVPLLVLLFFFFCAFLLFTFFLDVIPDGI
jgi:hypothetical protein